MITQDNPTQPAESQTMTHRWDFEQRKLILEGTLSASEPAELVNKWLGEYHGQPLGDDVCIEIDVRAVHTFDSSGIAILVMLRHRLMESGTWMRLTHASGQLIAVVELLGLQVELGLHL